MKKLTFLLAICFTMVLHANRASGAMIMHNMTSTYETIYIGYMGATINVTMNGYPMTLVDYTGEISGPEIIWGTDWYNLTVLADNVMILLDFSINLTGIHRQARLYLKDRDGKDYQLVINQNPY